MPDLWTAEDVERGVDALTDPPELWEFCTAEQAVKTVLAALADAGRLSPPCSEEEPCKQCNALLRDLGYGLYDEPEEIRLAVHGAPWQPVQDTEEKP